MVLGVHRRQPGRSREFKVWVRGDLYPEYEEPRGQPVLLVAGGVLALVEVAVLLAGEAGWTVSARVRRWGGG